MVAQRIDLSKFSGKRILIAGSSGLIGGLMFDVLREGGYNVYAPMRSWLLDQNPMNIGRYDYVVHAAGYGQPAKFTKMPTDTIMVNTKGVRALANCLDKGGTFLFLSSSEVYGPQQRPTEAAPVGDICSDHPRACYVYGKLAGEALCHALRGDLFDYKPKIARVALAYGPGVQYDDTRVMSDFIRSSIETGQIVLKDGGMAVRTYCYITDTVEMLFNIMLRGKSTVYNVAGVGPMKIWEMAAMVARMTDGKVLVPRGDMVNAAAPLHVEPSIGKYQSEFGRPDYVPFHVGLERTIEWFKSQQLARQP